MFTMDDLFDIAIKMEKNGEAVYVDSVSKIDNTDLRSLLRWMADEEARHRKWFEEQKNRHIIEVDEANLKEMVPGVLQQMMGEKTLSLDDIDFSKLENITDLLNTFIGFEEETIMFYQMLEMFIDEPSVIKGLDLIINEEKNHVEKLREMIEIKTQSKNFSGSNDKPN